MKINSTCLFDWQLWPLKWRVERTKWYEPIKVSAKHIHQSFQILIQFWQPEAAIHVTFSAKTLSGLLYQQVAGLQLDLDSCKNNVLRVKNTRSKKCYNWKNQVTFPYLTFEYCIKNLKLLITQVKSRNIKEMCQFECDGSICSFRLFMLNCQNCFYLTFNFLGSAWTMTVWLSERIGHNSSQKINIAAKNTLKQIAIKDGANIVTD